MILAKDVVLGEQILFRQDDGKDSYSSVVSMSEKLVDFYFKIHTNSGLYLNADVNCLTYDNGYSFENVEQLKNVIVPSRKNDIYNYDKSLSDVGWFIGTHTGDGTCDRKFCKNKNEEYYKYRLRNLGDNENVIKKYSEFVNGKTNSNVRYKISTNPIYRSVVWEYCVANRSIENIVNEYFDGKFGNKTYSGCVYSYIIKNNLWIPYIAGLVDSDGTIKENGSIVITMCMKDALG